MVREPCSGVPEITTPPPDPCNPNPILLGFFVNACGTEENNEFLAMWSGGGFYVSDLSITYDDPANNGCGFQSPSGDVVSSIGDDCPGAVYVGPGEAVPANVPVIIFTSASTDFNYNFGGLCANFGTVYVLQSSCTPSGEGVFPQTGSGSATTTVSNRLLVRCHFIQHQFSCWRKRCIRGSGADSGYHVLRKCRLHLAGLPGAAGRRSDYHG
jgi:hypothetical protein